MKHVSGKSLSLPEGLPSSGKLHDNTGPNGFLSAWYGDKTTVLKMFMKDLLEVAELETPIAAPVDIKSVPDRAAWAKVEEPEAAENDESVKTPIGKRRLTRTETTLKLR